MLCYSLESRKEEILPTSLANDIKTSLYKSALYDNIDIIGLCTVVILVRNCRHNVNHYH